MRKIAGTVLMFGVCLGLAACAHNPVEPTTEASAAVTEPTTVEYMEPICVGIIFNGILENNIDNQAFYSGALTAAEESKAELRVMDGENEEDWEAQVLKACEDGCDYVVGTAPEIADYISKYGANYPEIMFVALDAEVSLENVVSVYVSQEDAYFRAGVLAAEATKQTEIQGINEDAVIGWIGGMNIPIVKTYYMAFEKGAKSVDPEIQILEQYTGSWEDPEEGQRLALALYEQGADVVVGLAGGSNEGVVNASEEAGFYLITASNEMEQIGYLVVQKLLQEEAEGGTTMELTMGDNCVVLNGLPSTTETMGKEVPVESLATDANA